MQEKFVVSRLPPNKSFSSHLFCEEKIVPFRPQENNIFNYFLAKKNKNCASLQGGRGGGEREDSLPGGGRGSSKLITFAGPW